MACLREIVASPSPMRRVDVRWGVVPGAHARGYSTGYVTEAGRWGGETKGYSNLKLLYSTNFGVILPTVRLCEGYLRCFDAESASLTTTLIPCDVGSRVDEGCSLYRRERPELRSSKGMQAMYVCLP